MDLIRFFMDAEDRLFLSLRLTSHERALYYHLLRHSRLEGCTSVARSKQQLADALDLAPTTIRNSLRALDRAGCIRIAARLGLRGLLIEVRLPSEIPDLKSTPSSPSTLLLPRSGKGRATGRFRSPAVRAACFTREQGRCFYCLRALRPGAWSLDHVVPAGAGGDDSPANAVASCHECNCRKAESSAEDYLRGLYRRGILTLKELTEQLKRVRVFLSSPRT